MKGEKWEMGPLGSRLFAWSQMTGRTCLRTAEVAEELRMPMLRASELLDRMARDGKVLQLTRGLYLLPEKLPPGGRWQPPVEAALWHFLTAKGCRWQETGPVGMNFYGLSEQLANVSTIYNDKYSGTRCFGKLEVILVKVAASRIGNFVEIEIAPGKPERRRVGTLARVVFDALYDYSKFGTLPKAYGWIEQRALDKPFLKEIVSCALNYGNIATCRRLGWALETLGAPGLIVKSLKGSLRSSTAYIPMDPTRPARGRTNKTWGVVENFVFPGGPVGQ